MSVASGAAGGQVPVLLGLAAYTYFVTSVPVFTAPYVAADFDLEDAQMAFLAGLVSVGALGTSALARFADRHGRRRAILFCFGLLPPVSLATALAPGVTVFALMALVATALFNTLRAVVIVFIAEEVEDSARARSLAWFGLVGAFGGAAALLLATFVDRLPGGWRAGFALGAVPLLAWPWVRRTIPETARFARADARGATSTSRMGDLLRGRYRRRGIGLLVAGTLRPVALTAISTWPYYHAIDNLALDPWMVTVVYAVGGGLGMVGLPIGRHTADHWGRRGSSVLWATLSIASGVAYFWVPGGDGIATMFGLGVSFCGFNLGIQAFGVADRCLDTEAFPTHLRATYAGWRAITEAVARVTSQFALAALVVALGGLAPAITVLCVASFAPSVVVFLWTAPETRGLSLEAAALEDPADA